MTEHEQNRSFRLPGVPDLDEMQRTLEEVKSGALLPDEQAAKEQFLLECVAAIQQAIPLESLVRLTKGIEQIVNDLNAKKQAPKAFTPTDTMALDAFQGAYKGGVEVRLGRGKKATATTRTIAVHKIIYEDELARVGEGVQEPSYWLPQYNRMTVYFPGERYEVEIAWLLGEYEPNVTRIPAGIHPTPEQIAQWMSDGVDDIAWKIEVIKRHLRTPEQKAWMDAHDVSISDVLDGRFLCDIEEVERMVFDDWNARLGVKVFGF